MLSHRPQENEVTGLGSGPDQYKKSPHRRFKGTGTGWHPLSSTRGRNGLALIGDAVSMCIPAAPKTV